MGAESDLLTELTRLRIREQCLAQDLSEAVHLFYSVLLWISRQPESERRRCTLAFIRAKFHQMPQASRLGQMFVEIDTQFGRPLESNGVNLERWVFEPRGGWNG
jgi:hypothetical protein